MANAEASYKDIHGKEISLWLDIDLKTQRVDEFIPKGSLKSNYDQEFEELKNLVVGKTLSEISKIKRCDLKKETLLPNGKKALTSLSLWLLHKSISDYLGAETILEQNDLLCLCFGVTRRDLKKEILDRPDYDLPALIAETKATSACGSCKPTILKTISDLRSEHALIKGLDHSQSRLDKEGHWIKVKDLYPSELIIKLDDLKNVWMKREGISNWFSIEIENIEGHHVWLSVKSLSGAEGDKEKFEKYLLALSDFWKSETGVLFFVHLVF